MKNEKLKLNFPTSAHLPTTVPVISKCPVHKVMSQRTK